MASHLSTAQLVRLLGPWSDTNSPLPTALATTIEDLVNRGFVPAGAMLPPQRELASALGVSRGTVAAALELLAARGYTSSRQGSGTRVRSTRAGRHRHDSGRLFSFTDTSVDVIDLSTGALPASRVARLALTNGWGDLTPYLDTDGYFPAGIPLLRQAIAHHLSSSGIETTPDEILVTNGAQHATQLAIRGLLSPGDLVLCEDPTYRGALEALTTHQVRVEGVPVDESGIDVGMVARALRRRPQALHCQTSIHNPTGVTLTRWRRRDLAEVINAAQLPVIEDCCSWDLTLGPAPAQTLAGAVEPRLHVSCWTLSKLFWGGVRIGWIRATPEHIRTLTELRKSGDLATSVTDQLIAVRLLEHVEEARAERRDMLSSQLAVTEQTLNSHLPHWRWAKITGGSGLWVDTGCDVLALTKRAGSAGVKLAPGPSFSPHEGHRQRLRMPISLDPDRLEQAVTALQDA